MRQVHDQKGSSTVELVIIAPALLTLIMFVVQFALVAHAQNVAEAAAQEGVTAARQFGATESDGRAKTDAALSSLGPKMLPERHVAVTRNATRATVTVTGRALSLVPGYKPRISETASGPVERYVRPEEDRP